MSETSDILDLPLLQASQAQKHVTHNEALMDLDAIVQLSVKDRDLTAPPDDPTDGDRYIVAASATGDWADHDDDVAVCRDGDWVFYTPADGWRAWMADESRLLVWDGTRWIAGLREQLTADRTYYVRPDGDDSNDGLSDSASGAFLTIQQAIDAAVALDLSIYAVTINVAKGTYAENVTLKSYLGVGPITLVGDTTTPTNVDIAPASGTAVAAPQVTGVWALDGFELSSDVTCLDVSNYSVVNIDNIAFNGTGTHIYSHVGAYINGAGGSFAILQATCARHVFVHLAGAQAALNSATCTLPTDGLDSSTAFADVSALSFATFASATFINGAAATGLRYVVDSNAVINGGGNANLLPGDTAGTTATGGQYT